MIGDKSIEINVHVENDLLCDSQRKSTFTNVMTSLTAVQALTSFQSHRDNTCDQT